MNGDITGKTLIFSDLHCGLSSNKVSKLNIVINVVKEILKYVKANKIENILFLGDWHHSRVTSENNTLNVSYKLATALSKACHVTMLLGNHDIYFKNSVDVNSLVVFDSIPNIDIVKTATPIKINGKDCLLVPWLGDLTQFKKSQFQMMFGHFEVSAKYLIRSYVEDHSNLSKTSDLMAKMIDNDNIFQNIEEDGNTLDKKIDEAVKTKSKAGDFIGDFVELVKPNGLIFSGHIHGRREFLAKKRKFVFVGSPYQQNKGEIDNRCGFYILNEDGSYEFHEIDSPKHVLIKTSEVIKTGVDEFDFSIVKGNIVQRVYDKDIDKKSEAKMNQKITDFKPYEEMMPEYDVALDSISSSLDIDDGSSASLIKKSKLEYIKNYVDNIDQKILDEQSITTNKLYGILEQYYNAVAEL